jgi:hypothetical protein
MDIGKHCNLKSSFNKPTNSMIGHFFYNSNEISRRFVVVSHFQFLEEKINNNYNWVGLKTV